MAVVTYHSQTKNNKTWCADILLANLAAVLGVAVVTYHSQTKNNKTWCADILLANLAALLGVAVVTYHSQTKNNKTWCADILLANLAALLGVAVVLALGQPLLAAAFVPLAVLYRWLQARPGCQGSWRVLRGFHGSGSNDWLFAGVCPY